MRGSATYHRPRRTGPRLGACNLHVSVRTRARVAHSNALGTCDQWLDVDDYRAASGPEVDTSWRRSYVSPQRDAVVAATSLGTICRETPSLRARPRRERTSRPRARP